MTSTVEWITTTESSPWQRQEDVPLTELRGMPNVIVGVDAPRQRIDGIGGCFNELGWDALSLLSEEDRERILRDFFAPGAGLNLSLCRMPIGANDFSRDWYSYDEVAGDLALEHFDVANDRGTLIPYIRAAQRHNPELRLWASPWSPPTWMKTNGHYAAALPWPGSDVENGLRPDQVGTEGTDLFRVDDDGYLEAYARYFARFVEAYGEEGIRVETVMPQNEFNSAQVFPSCVWSAEGLARFIALLGPEMARLGVRVFLGTQERPHDEQIELVLAHPEAGPWVSGVGFQWAGKGAIAAVRHAHPSLALYQTEQECGDGRNDWRFCRYAWGLMKHFFTQGVESYAYWNLALTEGGVSRWGWAQNSLVVVDPETRTARYTHEYFLLRHVSHFLQPGARRLDTFSWTGHENQLAFANPDGSTVIVLQNDLGTPLPVSIAVGDVALTPTLPADSFSTLVLRP
ncbi:beta-glycosidase [Rathayibacter sp. ZW T2_19]|uniref:Beta-glycosidase n=1 Tax=Rathayibacter rubneri TaxID=2950106 RepID=A0A9X2ISD6_9MICO|nr:glycoside hydrolase family 30 protein [Rathayibacter rubneri]MCM6761817.1 beta-glycosidase [Rathayibacter rubneri]